VDKVEELSGIICSNTKKAKPRSERN